jgi:hypothetical protein
MKFGLIVSPSNRLFDPDTLLSARAKGARAWNWSPRSFSECKTAWSFYQSPTILYIFRWRAVLCYASSSLPTLPFSYITLHYLKNVVTRQDESLIVSFCFRYLSGSAWMRHWMVSIWNCMVICCRSLSYSQDSSLISHKIMSAIEKHACTRPYTLTAWCYTRREQLPLYLSTVNLYFVVRNMNPILKWKLNK